MQLKPWVMSQQISSIKLRNPSKQSYLIIYYTFYLIKISIFLFFNYFSLFTRKYYSLFFCFFTAFYHVTLTIERKKRSPQPQLFTVWVQSHSQNCFSLPFPTWPWQKKEKKRNPQPQLLTVWVLWKRESLLHNIRVWYFRKIVVFS